MRGNDVYILTETGGYGQYEIRNLIFHSHDGGETFACQTDWTETIHKRGHISDYTLCFAPTDPTGRTIWLAGNDYSWVKTTDGFKPSTRCRATTPTALTEWASGITSIQTWR